MLTQPGERISVETMCEPHFTQGDLSREKPAWRLPSWNGLLAVGHDLALRAGWAGQERTVTWTLSARPSAVRTARRLSAARLSAWQLAEPTTGPAAVPAAETATGTAVQLVERLVADALARGAEKIKLTLSAEDGLLRCEVDEQRASHAVVRPSRAACADLDRLACCWGAAGAVVWFELRLTPQH
ncbi:hypothetical protein [Nonomuraea turcica]|uniref:hypothetical protein n=1 Tax=Nonomuraea sp. G32 TaxID=3067274 RepID=UPI00273C7AEB|nr:hypothetical protein [Nonomuraea sp. G32]MDP4505140.1 hypothetical protein [Nonomuraea sp. G32]